MLLALSLSLCVDAAWQGDIEAVDKRYCQPTPDEAAGRVCFPDGPTLKNDYGVSCKEAW